MTECLSDTSRYAFEYNLATWLRSFERDLHQLAPLDAVETEAFLRFVYQENYDSMTRLHQAQLLPRSTNGNSVSLIWASPIHCQGHVRVLVIADGSLPAFQGFDNTHWLHSNGTGKLFAGLPERHQQAILDLERVRDALLDLHTCLQTYTRVRWLLAQWPNALRLFPKHVQNSLNARTFKRPPPKHVTSLKPETLQTLAWLSVIYPMPEL